MLGEIEKDLQESIKKNLPAQIGEELRLVLIKGKEDAAKLVIAEDKNVELNKTINVQQEQIRQLNEKLSLAGDIDAREKAVAEAERNIKIEKLEYQLKSEQDKTNFAQNVALGLVRNTEYRKSVNGMATQILERNGYQDTVNNPYGHHETETTD